MQQNAQLIVPALTDNSFEANGVKYLIDGTMSTARFQAFERLEMEIGLASGNAAKEIRSVYDALNASKVADAARIAYNLLERAARMDDKQPSRILLACTTFINREGEDLSRWSETEAADKIADWALVDVRFFLACYRAFLRAFSQPYNQDTPNFLEQEIADEFGDLQELPK